MDWNTNNVCTNRKIKRDVKYFDPKQQECFKKNSGDKHVQICQEFLQ